MPPISVVSVCLTRLKINVELNYNRSDAFESVDSFLRHCGTTGQKGAQVEACNPAPLRQFELLEGTCFGFNIHWHVGTINHAYVDNPFLLLAGWQMVTRRRAYGLRTDPITAPSENLVGVDGDHDTIPTLFDECNPRRPTDFSTRQSRKAQGHLKMCRNSKRDGTRHAIR
jgi:hypothetical protein